MAGFFGLFDYNKEGKGVYPDEPPKGPFATFFGILGRKFWKICSINLLYVLLSLPALIVSFLGAVLVLQIMFPQLNLSDIAALGDAAMQGMMITYVILGMALTGLSLIIIGPVHAGVTFVLRNYSREEHAFIWMDFKEHARKNLKQSIISSLFSVIFTLVFSVNYAFYSTTTFFGDSILRMMLQALVIILFVFWCIMQMYLYPMMVTFDLSLKQLYKNCLLFTFLRLPFNILILLCSLLILLGVPLILLLFGYGITILIAVVWYIFIAFALNLLLTNFFVYRGLDRYMIQKIKADEEASQEDQADNNHEN